MIRIRCHIESNDGKQGWTTFKDFPDSEVEKLYPCEIDKWLEDRAYDYVDEVFQVWAEIEKEKPQ